ncbi:MAG TPA: alkaline phosphatase PhoX, partial [Jiangellaceae bacterium]|nr:alkaline phosphatase PhoX [Jiangellaceae bacterium]
SREGFDREIFFTNEETPDYVFRREDSWPPPLGDPAEEEAGLVVALDVRTGKHMPIYGMGRHNHENSVAIPGYGKPVVVSGDDTFTSGPLTGVTFPPGVTVPAQSQLYSYIAPNTKSLLADKGDLWAFVSDTPGVKNYYDVIPGSGTEVKGHFIKVPKNIATGRNADGSELKAADVGFPPPPNNGSWQLDLRTAPPNQVGIDGPQWVLEYWSDINNVFQFVRVEDIAYDKRPGMGNVVYVVDSGRGRTAAQSLDTPNFRSTNGRVWKMVFDPNDPTKVTSMTVFVEGDDAPVQTPTEVHQPDNIESTPSGILLTEDPGSSQQFPVGSTNPAATTARLWYVPFVGVPEVVAKVDQSGDGGPTDVDGRAPGNWGAWESSGIVDASEAFGRGAYLINVQAHTLWVERAPGDDNNGDGQPDFTFKREGGQLALIRIPR